MDLLQELLKSLRISGYKISGETPVSHMSLFFSSSAPNQLMSHMISEVIAKAVYVSPDLHLSAGKNKQANKPLWLFYCLFFHSFHEPFLINGFKTLIKPVH